MNTDTGLVQPTPEFAIEVGGHEAEKAPGDSEWIMGVAYVTEIWHDTKLQKTTPWPWSNSAWKDKLLKTIVKLLF